MRSTVLGFSLGLWLIAVPAGTADANCRCLCIDGAVTPVCTGPQEQPPLCAERSCPLSPAIPPATASQGTTDCRPIHVFIPRRRRYEWRQLCE